MGNNQVPDLEWPFRVPIIRNDCSAVEFLAIEMIYDTLLSALVKYKRQCRPSLLVSGVSHWLFRGGDGVGDSTIPNTALKLSYPVTLTQPDVLLGKISTWSTVLTGLMKSLSPCHVVLKGS